MADCRSEPLELDSAAKRSRWNSLPDDFKHLVLVNGEEQYSLWRGDVAVPGGWSVVKEGTKDECLAFIDATWLDMRPRSLRQRMDDARK